MSRVERKWEGSVVALLGGGPSLTPEIVELALKKADRVLAINNGINICPKADALYFCDRKWFRWHEKSVSEFWAFGGKVFYLDTEENKDLKSKLPGSIALKQAGHLGLSLDANAIYTGHNSGYQALNLLVHLGATRAVLLGFDMKEVDGRCHWHEEHPIPSDGRNYVSFIDAFATGAPLFAAAGLEILNATPGSALKCFPQSTLEAAFA